jgi:hypothetical protein
MRDRTGEYACIKICSRYFIWQNFCNFHYKTPELCYETSSIPGQSKSRENVTDKLIPEQVLSGHLFPPLPRNVIPLLLHIHVCINRLLSEISAKAAVGTSAAQGEKNDN